MGALANSLRIEQSRQQLDSLRAEIVEWLGARREQDKQLKQHFTQINVLEKALNAPLDGVRAELDKLQDSDPTGELYRACRIQDNRVVFVRRTLDYFRNKFDQREDKKFKDVLAAADEIVWSCYAEVFENVTTVERRSVPLPYIDAIYAPEAHVRDRPPPGLAPAKSDQLLFQFLQKLPIPLVSLPGICVDAPWLLIFLAHEVGHHIEFDLAPEWGLVNAFGKWLAERVEQKTQNANEGAMWRKWNIEMFADACAICLTGTSAARAMIELEMADDEAMLVRNRGTDPWTYPSAVARIEWMARLCEAFGLSHADALGDFDVDAYKTGAPILKGNTDLRAQAANDFEIIKTLAENLPDYPFDNLGSFREWFGWKNNAAYLKPNGDIQDWTDVLLGNIGALEMPSLYAPRLIAGAGYRAYTELAAQYAPNDGDDPTTRNTKIKQRTERLAELKQDFYRTIAKNHEIKTRAAAPIAQPDLDALGDELTQLMLNTLNEPESLVRRVEQ